jgi:hypothetical protein
VLVGELRLLTHADDGAHRVEEAGQQHGEDEEAARQYSDLAEAAEQTDLTDQPKLIKLRQPH